MTNFPHPNFSQEELPVILKHKKNLQKHILDWNTIKSRYWARAERMEWGWAGLP